MVYLQILNSLRKTISFLSSFLLIILAFWQFIFIITIFEWKVSYILYFIFSFYVLIFFIHISFNQNIFLKLFLLSPSFLAWLIFQNIWNHSTWVKWFFEIFPFIFIEVISARIYFFFASLFLAYLLFIYLKKHIHKLESSFLSILFLFFGFLLSAYSFYYPFRQPILKNILSQEDLKSIFLSSNCFSESIDSPLIPLNLTHNRAFYVNSDDSAIYLSLGNTFNFHYPNDPVLVKIPFTNIDNYQILTGCIIRDFHFLPQNNLIYAIDYELNLLYIIDSKSFTLIHILHLPLGFKETVSLIVNEQLHKLITLSLKDKHVVLVEYELPDILHINVNLLTNYTKDTFSIDYNIFHPMNKLNYIIHRFSNIIQNIYYNYANHLSYLHNTSTLYYSEQLPSFLKITNLLDFDNLGLAYFGSQPFLLKTNSKNNKYYVILSGSPNTFIAIDSSSFKVEKYILFNDYISALAIDDYNHSLFISFGFKGNLLELNLDNFTVKNTFEIPHLIMNIVLDNSRNLIYLLDYKLGKLWILNRKNKIIIKNYIIGNKPRGMFLSLDAKYLYILSYCGVFKLDLLNIIKK